MTRQPAQAASGSDELRETVRATFAEVLQCDPDDIDLTRRITELPGMDSLNLVHAVVACEEQCAVSLDEDQLFDVRTGDDLCGLIERARQEGTGRS